MSKVIDSTVRWMRENVVLSRTDKFQVFHGEKVQICREQFEGFKYNVVELTHSVVSHELCPRWRLSLKSSPELVWPCNVQFERGKGSDGTMF